MAVSPIEKLERDFAGRWGAPGAVATGFGRGAVYLALEAIGVRDADVLVPDFICAQVLHAIERAGAKPVFYPMPLDLAAEPATIKAAATQRTRAAILVHYFGAPQPRIRELAHACAELGICALEDCSLALLARHPQGLCGTFGDYAAFSFTKNNWCDGGGVAVARSSASIAAMRRIRNAKFSPDAALCTAYGRLCALDFEANLPSRCSQAAARGMALQAQLARSDARFAVDNFFDAAPCTVEMSPQAAERAVEILRSEEGNAEKRRGLYQEICASLPTTRKVHGIAALPAASSNGSFVVLQFPAGDAKQVVAAAAESRITLRAVWPAYQHAVPRTGHADQLATLEVHPELTASEMAQILNFFQRTC